MAQYINFKVVMLGDSNVGKATLFSQFTGYEFETESSSRTRIHRAIRYGEIDDKKIKVEFCDTNSRERPLEKGYYKDTTVALIVYDITNRASYENVKGWLKELREQNTDSNIVTVLVGNKSDLGHLRAVSKEELKSFAVKENVFYAETTALSEEPVGQLFMDSIIEAARKKELYGVIKLTNAYSMTACRI